MSFIRVTLRGSKDKVDVNSAYIVSYKAGFADGVENGAQITMLNDDLLLVNESPRSLRSFIKKAQGILPAPASDLAPVEAAATGE